MSSKRKAVAQAPPSLPVPGAMPAPGKAKPALRSPGPAGNGVAMAAPTGGYDVGQYGMPGGMMPVYDMSGRPLGYYPIASPYVCSVTRSGGAV
jgi:hypothetical protein